MNLIADEIKGIIMDVDGTLLDSLKVWDNLCSSYLKKQNITPPENIDQIVSSMSLNEGIAYLINNFNINKSAKKVSKEIDNIIHNYYKTLTSLKPFAIDFLKLCRAKNIPIVLLTTGNKKAIKSAIKKFKIQKYFKKLICTDDYHTNKENPAVFKIAQSFICKKNINPQNILVIEDSLTPVKTAKNAGYKVIGIKDNYSKSSWYHIESIADFFINNFSEINFS